MLLVSIVSVRLTVEPLLVLFEIYEVLCDIRDQGDGLGPTVISSDAKEAAICAVNQPHGRRYGSDGAEFDGPSR